jgi:hypothetical protein
MARSGQSTGEFRPSQVDSAFGHDPFPMAMAPARLLVLLCQIDEFSREPASDHF